MKVTCSKCGKSEHYATKNKMSKIWARLDFEKKHKECKLEIKQKDNVLSFPVKDAK